MKYGHRNNLHEKQLKMIHKTFSFLLWTCLWSYPHLWSVSRSSISTGNTCGRTAIVRPWSTRKGTSLVAGGDSRTVSRPRWPSSPGLGPTPLLRICTWRPVSYSMFNDWNITFIDKSYSEVGGTLQIKHFCCQSNDVLQIKHFLLPIKRCVTNWTFLLAIKWCVTN